jgi:hypothetical protein
MATVYRAYEPGLDRYVALKVLPEDSLSKESAVQRFNLEARAVARLAHPFIVPLLAFGLDEPSRTPWMALQLVEGGSLAGLLGQGPIPPRRIAAVLRGVASALDYAHGQGVLHRDVKPQNVLLGPDHHVYLADFGLARMLEASTALSATGTVMGTPQYMAPEQAMPDPARPIDGRADIYALGIMTYEMLVGRPPFMADTPLAVLMKHVQDPIPIPSPALMPEPLLQPVLRALAKDRDARWPTATAFVDALEPGLSATSARPAADPEADRPTVMPVMPAAPTVVARAPEPPGASPSAAWILVPLVGGALLLFGMLFVTVWLWVRDTPAPGPTAAGEEQASRAPVTVSGQLSNDGWSIVLNVADGDVREIFRRVDDEVEFRSLGFTPVTDPRTGRPAPATFFGLPPEAAATDQHRISVKWTTGDGRTRGPYDLTLSLAAELVKSTRYILDTVTPGSWIAFREYPEGHRMALFTHLMSYRNALREVRYSVDDTSLSQRFPFKPWKDLGSTPRMGRDDRLYIEIPFTAAFMAVQLQYLDGTESEIRTFRVGASE